MKHSYGTDSIAYLRRARARLDERTNESLFYAGFELRCGTEARLQDYLDAREDIAKHKKQGWKIVGSTKELDHNLQLGDRVFEVLFFSKSNDRLELALYYTPVTTRLRESAGARLHDLLHAMKKPFDDHDRWWADTRAFLEQIYSDLAFASKGTLLAPIMRSPDGQSHRMTLCLQHECPIVDKARLVCRRGSEFRVRVRHLDSLPKRATPFLNRIDAIRDTWPAD